MAPPSEYIIIWGDAQIGSKHNCSALKTDFQAGVAQVAAVPPLPRDPIDELICAVREYGAPIEFADTPEDTLNLIGKKITLGKKIILITSATLGREIYDEIVSHKSNIHSYYIFCLDMAKNRDFGNDCIAEDIEVQMFDHQTTLLIRLGRDMSRLLTEEGKRLLDRNDPETALIYFNFAYDLAEKAVENDKPLSPDDKHIPNTSYRKELNDLKKKAEENKKN